MLKVRKPIGITHALQKVLQKSHVATEYITVPLEKSDGYALAEDIIAPHDVPPFNRSRYDGFAIRSVDTKNASIDNKILFRIIDHIGAGQSSEKELKTNEAIRIMTGAILPKRADAIVMLEQSEDYGQTFTISKVFSPCENVFLQGEDAKAGDMLIPKGNYIHSGIIALLATFGITHINVIKRPIVGVLATGTELLSLADDLQPGKIRNSNGPMIVSQLKSIGIKAKVYGMIHDDKEHCYKIVKKALTETDCVITTGGVSVGDYDHLPYVYEKLGAHILFDKVAMRPGSVTTVAYLHGKFLFGLSGNPSSCFTGFELFVRPALRKMVGNSHMFLPQIKANIMENIQKPNEFTRFIRGFTSFNGQHVTVRSAGFNGPNAVTSLANANAFIVIPPGKTYRKGMEVTILLLGVSDGVAEWSI